MCPGVPAAIMRGTNACTPFRMPQRLTSRHPGEVGGRSLPHHAAGEHAGVVAEHVARTEHGVGEVGEGCDFVGVAHVRHEGEDVVACGRRLGERVAFDIGPHDPHALGVESFDQCTADPAAGPGDDGNLPVELFHRGMVAEDERCERMSGSGYPAEQ